MVWLLVLSLFISSFVNNIYVDSSDGPAGDDRDALIAFKNKIVNDYNNCTLSWNAGLVDASTWFQVSCNENNRVIRVDLGECDIFGVLVSDFGSLSELQYLNLGGNVLNESIPPNFGSLDKLIQMNLSSNIIQGNIPPELGNLTSLENLYLQDNFLEGSIPNELSKLNKLEVLDLSFNNLNGTVHEDLSKKFPHMVRVNLTWNNGTAGRGGLAGNCTEYPCCYENGILKVCPTH